MQAYTYTKPVLLSLALAVIFGHVTAKGHSQTGRHINPNVKYVACQAGTNFAVRIAEREIRPEERERFHSFQNKIGKDRFYYCRQCSMCGHGIQEIAYCWEAQDTKCGGCVDPSHQYDVATKSCQPKSVISGIDDQQPEIFTSRDDISSSEESHSSSSTQQSSDNEAPKILSADRSDTGEVYDSGKNKQMSLKGKEDDGVTNSVTAQETVTPVLVAVVAVFSIVVVALLVFIAVSVVQCRRSKKDENPIEEV